MANKNREDLKTGFQSMIDRTAPYDGEPLIQKADHQITIGDDLMDSALVKLPTVGSINSPAAAFNVDFDFDGGRDRYDIDSTGSADAEFTITLAGLSDNQTGILNITKKSGDTFSFGNGLITPFNNTEGQDGQTSIVLFVKVVSSTYIVQIGYNAIVDTANIKDLSITNDKLDGEIEVLKTFGVDANGMNQVMIDIGSWDMNTEISKEVTHNLSLGKIRTVTCAFVNDQGTEVANMSGVPYNLLGTDFSNIRVFSAYVKIYLTSGSTYRTSGDWNGTGFNRGWVIIQYID